ncbi:hypothetical protein TRVA0_004S00738 [Trichomonascus vanleenenianus]|uniref:NAD(P)/FAD-dependent oxidoreductase n=1 Tax=Trichomonascus vanleenenianus TaxID=2268995 RepID=UPI003ECB3E4D
MADFQSGPTIPQSCDYLIVGGGFSGASLAYHLTEMNRDARIVLVEAREACSGASGRNGGHLLPTYTSPFVEFEKRNFVALQQLIHDNGIDCWTNGDKNHPGYNVYLSADDYARAKQVVVDYVSRGILGQDEVRLIEPAEATDKFGFEIGGGALAGPATPINPYRLVGWLLTQALGRGLELYTHTAVTSIGATTPEGLVPVTVSHRDGPLQKIHATKVFLATNAYTDYIESEAVGITPVRGQVARWNVRASELRIPLEGSRHISIGIGDEYLAVLPDLERSDRVEVVYGGFRRMECGGELGVIDDNAQSGVVRDALVAAARRQLGIAGAPDEEWCGIMGFCQGLPVLGPRRRSELLLCAGFTGHGMPRIFLSALAVARYAETGRWPDWVPVQFTKGSGTESQTRLTACSTRARL